MRARRLAARAAAALGLTVLLLALSHPMAVASSDLWGNVGPAGALGQSGPLARFPLSHYDLDQHFDAVSASLTGGIDVSGVPPMIAYFLASVLWQLTAFLASVLISLFGFAFDLDLLNGSAATGGQVALVLVATAIHSIYANVFGQPWLVLAVATVGIWAMWKALVQRRYSETAGALGLSLAFVVAAMFFVAEPASTIGAASKWTNEMSAAFLAISDHGDPSGGAQAKEAGAGQLFDLLVTEPWAVLEFGGVEHCALDGTGSGEGEPESAPVRPLSSNPARDAALSRRLQDGTEVQADGKTCVNNLRKYGAHFLQFASGSDERDAEYKALDDGEDSELPEADKARGGYRLGPADEPATDAMEQGGQYQRLLVAIVVFIGELGAFCLLGALSVGVILAQVFLLLLLAFAPVALVAAAIPGRGHAFFKGWLSKLAGFLLRKAAYSLILALLLAVNGALAGASSALGWLMSFGLQSLFFWGVFLQREKLTDSLIGIATGPRAPGGERLAEVFGLYYGARFLSRTALSAGRRALRGGGGRGGPPPPRGNPAPSPPAPKSAPRFGRRESIGLRGRFGPDGAKGSPPAGAGRQVVAGNPPGRPRRKPAKASASRGPAAPGRKPAVAAPAPSPPARQARPGKASAARPAEPIRKPDRAESLLLAELRAERERAVHAARAPRPEKAPKKPEQSRKVEKARRRDEKGGES